MILTFEKFEHADNRSKRKFKSDLIKAGSHDPILPSLSGDSFNRSQNQMSKKAEAIFQ